MSISTTPTFNLKVVIKETGIAADTLRAWERRYGLPMPGRTPGGHRLYSQRDIEIVKWLMEKQREGMSISRAVDMWNELTASGQDPLPVPGSQKILPVADTNLDIIREQWLDACMAFDERTAEQVLNQAFAAHPLETVCVEVMQRGLQEIGEMWYRNEINIQQEHFTSALVQRRLDAMIAAAPPPNRPYTILVGCIAGDLHVFVPLLLTLLLRRRGFNVIYLGANVPALRFNEALQVVKPHLVILSTQLLQNANTLRKTAEELQVSGARVAYGGRIFNWLPDLRNRIPAYFLGDSVPEAMQTIEILITQDKPLQGIQPVSSKDVDLGNEFDASRLIIESQVIQEARALTIPSSVLGEAIHQLGKNLSSAISLGNLDFVSVEMEWIRGLLKEHNHDHKILEEFLKIYARAVDSVMGETGLPISSWLHRKFNGEIDTPSES
jgi:methanogenic corrinoid protein MtbC1